ncbi:hypothetical protein [Candidatus Ichthyocystis sparus]|uniref:hypothetical protein n=1 Tax=Candidatus Ichthyocystis sparus TaxID=1561004 RepID=UPI00159EC3B9|nr:hypothetical protein [Candidatus Ichthyocystis sparus]
MPGSKKSGICFLRQRPVCAELFLEVSKSVSTADGSDVSPQHQWTTVNSSQKV